MEHQNAHFSEANVNEVSGIPNAFGYIHSERFRSPSPYITQWQDSSSERAPEWPVADKPINSMSEPDFLLPSSSVHQTDSLTAPPGYVAVSFPVDYPSAITEPQNSDFSSNSSQYTLVAVEPAVPSSQSNGNPFSVFYEEDPPQETQPRQFSYNVCASSDSAPSYSAVIHHPAPNMPTRHNNGDSNLIQPRFTPLISEPPKTPVFAPPSDRFQPIAAPPGYNQAVHSQGTAYYSGDPHSEPNERIFQPILNPPSNVSSSLQHASESHESAMLTPSTPHVSHHMSHITGPPNTSPLFPMTPPSAHPSLTYEYSPMSGPFSVIRGVENPAGENHCFLNVLIQSLYRLTEFRERFLEITHKHTNYRYEPHTQSDASDEDACVLCSLQTIWNAYKMQDSPGVLDPTGVRSALAQLDRMFERYQRADAVETLLKILEHLHEQLQAVTPPNMILQEPSNFSREQRELEACSSDVKTRCLIHQMFAWETQTITECPKCDVVVKREMGWTLLVDGMKLKKEWSILSSPQRLGKIVSDPSNLSNVFVACPTDQCTEKKAKKSVTLIAAPPIFQISVFWPWNPSTMDPAVVRKHSSDLLNAINFPLNLNDMYASEAKNDESYSLQGFVAFYGLHYVTFQLVRAQTGPPVWHQFNDDKVRLHASWDDCKEAALKGGYIPVLLWYVKNVLPSKK